MVNWQGSSAGDEATRSGVLEAGIAAGNSHSDWSISYQIMLKLGHCQVPKVGEADISGKLAQSYLINGVITDVLVICLRVIEVGLFQRDPRFIHKSKSVGDRVTSRVL